MNDKYRVRQDSVLDEEGREHTVYGIEVIDEEGQIIKSVSDVFSNCESAHNFVEICNEKKLSDTHFDDVVIDMIAYL